MWGYGYGGPWPFMGLGLGIMGIIFFVFMMLIPFVVLIYFIIFLKWLLGGRKGGKRVFYRGRGDDEEYLDILKSRYAKGEISKEQFEEMKKTLENT